MRREYESPVFVGEEYTFCSSIANSECTQDPNTVNKAIEIEDGTRVCGQCQGDKYNSKAPAYGYAKNEMKDPTPEKITVFNDGSDDVMGCQFDWNGTVVAQTGLGFTQSFYANSGNDSKHSPAIGSIIFNS